MTSASPKAAIMDRLQSNWTTAPVRDVDGNDPENFAPPADGATGAPTAWVGLEFPGGVSTIMDIGARHYREDGAFMVHVNVPTGTGASLALDYCDQIAAVFRGQRFSNGSLITYAPNPPVFNGIDGNYASYSFGVPYHYDFTG